MQSLSVTRQWIPEASLAVRISSAMNPPMSNFELGNLRPANPLTNLSRALPTRRSVNLLAAGALAALLIVPLPLRAQDSGSSASSSPMGQMLQLAVGQQYQLAPDPDNPDDPPQFQPVPNDDPDDSSANSDDDNNSNDNADNGDNDQNQNDDNSDNSQDNSSSDDNSPPPTSN